VILLMLSFLELILTLSFKTRAYYIVVLSIMFRRVIKIFFHSRTPRVKHITPLTDKSLIQRYFVNYFM